MHIDILYSSSDGNACRIFNGESSILIDCGVSRKQLFSQGKFPVDALFVSHSHTDHIRGAGVVGRSAGCPVFIEKSTYNALDRRNPAFFKDCRIKFCSQSSIVNNGVFEISMWATSHDGTGGLFYTVRELSSDMKFGLVTDTGTITEDMQRELPKCNGLLLESNHDQYLLQDYPGYPHHLKQRIRGSKGHLSNLQAVTFARDHLDFANLKWLTLGHLSPRTNTPEIVMNEFKSAFPDYNSLHVGPGRFLL